MKIRYRVTLSNRLLFLEDFLTHVELPFQFEVSGLFNKFDFKGIPSESVLSVAKGGTTSYHSISLLVDSVEMRTRLFRSLLCRLGLNSNMGTMSIQEGGSERLNASDGFENKVCHVILGEGSLKKMLERGSITRYELFSVVPSLG